MLVMPARVLNAFLRAKLWEDARDLFIGEARIDSKGAANVGEQVALLCPPRVCEDGFEKISGLLSDRHREGPATFAVVAGGGPVQAVAE
jgi:hypothetical protein